MILHTVISAYDIFYQKPEEKKVRQEKFTTDPYYYLDMNGKSNKGNTA